MDPGNTGQATQPPASIYIVRMTIPGSANSTGVDQNIFLSYDNTIIPSGAAEFGWQDSPGHDCSQCAGNVPPSCQNIATVAPDGTITMSLDLSATVTFGTCATTGGTNMTVSPGQWAPGIQLTNIQGATKQRFGGLLTGASVAKATTVGDGAYTVQGNVSCSNPPIAALAADVTSGNAPLTVNFNASASNMPTGSCGTIASYIFDFGDGNQVTQAAPTVAHTYTVGGATYPARVRVVSSKGVTSSNIAQQDITVNRVGPPQLVSVASRMTHGGALDHDIVLPQPPAARVTECRSSNGNYKLVLTFLNNLVSVASSSLTTGTGSILNSGLGPNANQYTVNLTGVTDIQTLTVTLNTAVDVSGASGDVPVILPLLIGDVNGNGRVTNGDVSAVQAQVGAAVDASNFRNDINANGTLSNGDVAAAQAKVGGQLP